ncbi:hypothetical protein JTE90_008506 [Oedothorax gibbosus]|uniref:Uncharacterized protein n=1 Tax=Oedothorax gibbosus TaxID=931172 RepID=A0AAV6UYX9_9ARAC|nr:hypothetical protein JTE90_008506 [Oedothorax gibbosus]
MCGWRHPHACDVRLEKTARLRCAAGDTRTPAMCGWRHPHACDVRMETSARLRCAAGDIRTPAMCGWRHPHACDVRLETSARDVDVVDICRDVDVETYVEM